LKIREFFALAAADSLVPVGRIRAFLLALHVQDVRLFAETVTPACISRKMLVYSLWLLRETPEIQDLLNEPGFPNALLSELIVLARTRLLVRDPSQEAFWKTSLSFLKDQKSMALILDEQIVRQDLLLVMQLMVNFDLRTVDDFLQQFPTPDDAVEYFATLFQKWETSDLRHLFVRNPDLFLYIASLFEAFSGDPKIADILERYSPVVANLSAIKDFATIFNGVFRRRNLAIPHEEFRTLRCVCLIQEIHKFQDISSTIETLAAMNVFEDDREMAIVTTFLTDPGLIMLPSDIPQSYQFMSSGCEWLGQPDPEILAVVKHEGNGPMIQHILAAMRCDRVTGKIERVDPADVRCMHVSTPQFI